MVTTRFKQVVSHLGLALNWHASPPVSMIQGLNAHEISVTAPPSFGSAHIIRASPAKRIVQT